MSVSDSEWFPAPSILESLDPGFPDIALSRGFFLGIHLFARHRVGYLLTCILLYVR